MADSRLVRCPIEDNDPGPHGRILGCGHLFEVSLAVLADDPDHFADCPSCGLFFDPDDPNSAPQPAEEVTEP